MTRAMILAAGLGTRLRPLTQWRAKPALPVRGIPVVAYLLEWLAAHGIHEVILNLHHLPHTVREAVEAFTPTGTHVSYSNESQLLGTGGGIRRARNFLIESESCVVLSGDMLLDLDLSGVISRHGSRNDLATLVLREDSRIERFGSIGIAEGGAVRRVARSLDLGRENAAGIFTGVRVLSRRALESLPDRDDFEDLRDWMLPRLAAGENGFSGDLVSARDSTWEPVGTPSEYLRANFDPPALSFFDADARATRHGVELGNDAIVGAGAVVEASASLQRCVVWDGERVAAGTTAENAVFANGQFHTMAEHA